jgi:trigger factor
MRINTVRSEGLVRELQVTIPVEDIRPVYESKLAELSKDFSLPGFRKGKAPAAQVKQRFGVRAFHDAANYLIQHTQQLALESNDFDFLGTPKVTVDKFTDEGAEIEYSMVVNLKPEMPAVDFSKFKTKKLVAKVTDADVTKHIEEAFANYPHFESEDSGAKAKLDDALMADVQFIVNGKAEDVQKNSKIRLSKEDKDDILVKGLVGIKAGEERTVKLDNIVRKDQVTSAECKVKAHSVLAPKKVKFDDEFAKEIGYEDLANMRSKYEEHLKNELNGLTNSCLKRELLDYIDQHAKFDVPEDLVHQELHSIAHQVTGAQVKENMTDEEHAALHSPEFDAEYSPVANRRVRLGLMLSEIGKKRNVVVTQEEIRAEIFKLAMQTGTPVEQIVAQINKNPNLLPTIQAPLFEDKVVQSIIEEVNLAETSVSVAELKAHLETVMDQDLPADIGSKKKAEPKKGTPKKKKEETE